MGKSFGFPSGMAHEKSNESRDRSRNKQMQTNLMGIDVGFSKTRRIAGIAILDRDQFTD